MSSRPSRAAAALLGMALLAAACGDSGDEPTTGSTTSAAGSTETTAAEVGEAGSAWAGAIRDISEAQAGTVQIVAAGSFRDPEVGFSTTAGSGSGFLISPDGLAVTNNHVVTGAATLEVFVGGDTTRSYNAQIVGVSECNDLALIQLDTDEDLPYFTWYEETPQAGLDVYAAGFPLGDPEFTLTRGIVAKARAGGDLTGTSSIDHTIEHDANIQPGNSGGPLLTADGQVVAVNYAGGASATTTAQFYAIASDLATEVVDQLREGDFESLGINGWAVADEASGITGIWVAGVAPGSPAAQAQILPGDIITTMNGLPVGTDGTFSDYCDVIRTAGDRPIAVEVLRFDTEEVLRGEINGTQPLTLSFSFAQEVEQQAEVAEGSGSYSGYQPVTDDTGVLTVEVPNEWTDIDSAPGTNADGSPVPYIAAAANRQAFLETWQEPGMLFLALSANEWTVDSLLAEFANTECTDGGIFDYADGVFTGKYQLFENCGGTDTDFVTVVSAADAGSPYIYLTSVQIVTQADLEALDHILQTFNLAG